MSDSRSGHISVNGELLRLVLERIDWRTFGDAVESKYGSLIELDFPNMERFWRLFIVPLTPRVEMVLGVICLPGLYISFRPGLDERLEELASLHYSTFCHLVYAHEHLRRVEQNDVIPSWMEDVYVHLVSACDLSKELVAKVHLLLGWARDIPSEILQLMSREEWLRRAGQWYDHHYPTLYDVYKKKGHFPAIYLANSIDLIEEFLSRAGASDLWTEYNSLDSSLRQFRNHLVHNIIVGRLRVDDQELVPRPTAIKSYRRWRQLSVAVNDEAIRARDFVKPSEQARQDLIALERMLNRVWEVVIKELEPALYGEEESRLRDLYRLHLTDPDPSSTQAVSRFKLMLARYGVSTSESFFSEFPDLWPDAAAGSVDWSLIHARLPEPPSASPLNQEAETHRDDSI